MFRGKRAFDLVGALGGVVCFAPVMLSTAAAEAYALARALR